MESTTTQSKHSCIYAHLTAQAEQTPHALAIAAPHRRPLTYAGLLTQTHAVRAALNSIGIGRNDRVVMALNNGPEMAVAFIAMASCVTCVPLNPNYRADEFEFYISRLNARALVVESESNSPAKAVGTALGLSIIELSPQRDAEAGIFQLSGAGGMFNARGGFAQPEEHALLLHTSGTTSAPKIVPLTHGNVCSMATNNQVFLGLTGEDLCLNVMPLFHSTGLIGVTLSSMMSGAGVVCPEGFYAPKFVDWFEEFKPTWFTAVPSIHQAILLRTAVERDRVSQNRLRFIRSSSSALPRSVLQELEATFDAPVIESYGLTECGMIACNPLPPGQRKVGSVGVPTLVELAIREEAGALLEPHQTGEVLVRGACVMSGYEDSAAVNEESFTGGWFKTGDQGFLDTNGYLFLTGRLKEIINRGGEKIAPLEVDEALMDHPSVEQAVTFGVPNELLGEEVAAAVVLHLECTATEKEIRDFVSKRLADFKVPRQILILTEIPKGSFGKIQRNGLAKRLGVKPCDQLPLKNEAGYTPPATWEESRLVEIWARVLGLNSVGIHDDFFALGGDSILATQVVSQVRKVMQVELSQVSLFEMPTVAELARSLQTTPKKTGDEAMPIRSVPRD
ncbi:MAG TPA: non-ribosomal peptide synthetase [Pyrinomonadaceae bacterium]|nr:non-ribosomal peptide synthetase [Pyrinomonadaceae bacterium]